MSLILPSGPSWAHCSTNLPPAPSVTAYGTTVAAGANNVDTASPPTLLAGLAHDVEYLVFTMASGSITNANTSALMDILVDPAGGTAWSELISDLLVGGTPVATQGLCHAYHFPLWLPAGASLGVRARTAHTSDINIVVNAWVFGGNRNPASWWCGQKVETVGNMNPAASRGQAHTVGASGSFSSWADLGAPLSGRTGAIQYAAQAEGDASTNATALYFDFGVGDVMIGPRILHFLNGAEYPVQVSRMPIFCDLPEGAQMRVRGTASAAGSGIDVAAYAVQ